MENKKKLGIFSVISTGAGLIVATSCLMTLGQGSSSIGITFIISMLIACGVNICTVLSMSELNAIMPDLTGGIAQYTLACMGPFMSIICMVGGYLLANTICGSVECAMFGNSVNSVFHTSIPSPVLCVTLIIIMTIMNLLGVDMFAKIQNVVVVFLLGSMAIMGVIGALGFGIGEKVSQPYVLSWDFGDITSMAGLAFFLYMGCEFAIPISKQVKNANKTLPLGMSLSLLIVCAVETLIILGMHNYTAWDELAVNASPHIFYGTKILGNIGKIWMTLVSIFAVVSTINSIISSLAYICAGMAKIKLLPSVFLKRNKHDAPYVGILLISAAMIIINCTGLSSTDEISFFILVICVFWMMAYVVSNINVLILRKKMPKVPRRFKVPGKGIISVIGIIGSVFMILNIDSDIDNRIKIYKFCLIIFAIMAIYAFVWIKFVMKKKLFQPMKIKDIMAMETYMK